MKLNCVHGNLGTDAADEPDLEDDEIESIGDKKSVCLGKIINLKSLELDGRWSYFMVSVLGLGAIRVFTKHINQLVDQGWNW